MSLSIDYVLYWDDGVRNRENKIKEGMCFPSGEDKKLRRKRIVRWSRF